MSSPQAPLPTGNRFSTYTPDDHGGVIWTTSLICIVYTTLTLLLRGYIKRKAYGLDDLVFALATLVGFGQFIAIFVATSYGLGKAFSETSEIQRVGAGQATLASQVIYLFVLCLAKCSIVLLIRRIFHRNTIVYSVPCDALLIAHAAWAIASILAVVTQCRAVQIIGAAPSHCTNQGLRWQLIGAFDAVTEVAVVVLTIYQLWQLQMNMANKTRVLAAFVFRLPVAVFAILHSHSIHNFLHASNAGVAITPSIVYQQIELCYSLISCTIPNLKSFLMNFDTGLGLDVTGFTSIPPGSTSDRNGGSYKMSSLHQLKKKVSRLVVSQDQRESGITQRRTAASWEHPRGSDSREDMSVTDGDSQRMIIRRDVQFSVGYDD